MADDIPDRVHLPEGVPVLVLGSGVELSKVRLTDESAL